MIIKNNNNAVDVLKNQHVCWEGLKSVKRFYAKKTETLIKTEYGSDPKTVPNISWEGGTTQKFNLYCKETYSIREGFTTRTEERIYNYPNATFKSGSGDTSDCTINNTPHLSGIYTYNNPFSVTFSKRDNASSDRTIIIHAMGLRGDMHEQANITITQTKRDKYVTKLDNASITTDLIPASGGNISTGKLTYRKTYNTGETENATENITFSTVSATTKGTTESDVTVVKTINSGGTIQKQTTIDGVTLTHPSFSVKQAANVKSVKTAESKKTTSVILSVSPTTVYSSGGLVTFSLQRMYTLNKVVYQYTSGSTSGGGSDANQGPETVSANSNYTISGVSGVTTVRDSGYLIPSSDTERTIKFQTTYDNIKSNEATVTLKLDGPNESKAFTYSDLKITNFSYNKDSSGYHFPASGGTISATDCTLEGTYQWTYTSMENKTVTETVKWTFADLTSNMYTFTPTSVTAESLGTTETSANLKYKDINVTVQNLIHTYNGKSYNVKNSSGTVLSASTSTSLTRQGNTESTSTLTNTELSVSVSPTSCEYTGGDATLTSKLIRTYNVTWTSGSTSTKTTDEDVTAQTIFTGEYTISGQTTKNAFSFSGTKITIPNILSSTAGRTYTFTGKYSTMIGYATLSQTGNTVLYTVTFHKNNTYGEWSKSTDNEYITKKFSLDTPYTELIPDETLKWIEGSNYKYNPTKKYSLTTQGTAVTSSSLLTEDIELYAIWETPTNYIKITFNPDGGTFTKTSDKSNTTTDSIYGYYAKGKIDCQPSDLGWSNSCTKTNFIFAGWSNMLLTYTTCPINFDNQGRIETFTAQYISDKVTITWDANGGLFSDNKSSKTLTIKRYETLNKYTENPTKAATESTTYTFKGWNTGKNGSTVITFPVTNVSVDTTYYAIYSSTTKTFKVTWNLNGGNISGSTDNKTENVEYGLTVSFTTYTPTRENYIFNGWSTSSTATSGSSSGKSDTITKDTTFYAIWQAYSTINLNPNGGTLTVGKEEYTTTYKFSYMQPSLDLSGFSVTRTNYTFVGWNEDKDATTGKTSFTLTSDKYFTGTKTYYAIWKSNILTPILLILSE